MKAKRRRPFADLSNLPDTTFEKEVEESPQPIEQLDTTFIEVREKRRDVHDLKESQMPERDQNNVDSNNTFNPARRRNLFAQHEQR